MKRLNKILSSLFIVASVLVLCWMAVSFIEVMLHQGDLFFKGTSYTYSNSNFFAFICNIMK